MFICRQGGWDEMRSLTTTCRMEVFVKEQQIPVEIEFDSRDATAWHFAVTMSGKVEEVVGSARLLPDGHIGRVCVLFQYRKLGVGRLVMEQALQRAKEAGHRSVVLESQTQAVEFYSSLGFKVNPSRGVFPVSGLPHVEMTLTF
ncbi:hypothetical protein BASA81_003312 [Batrachochytrium salamandrivorans]|nr:hypothetical protein BASA81_003312 [Batrachochytrium salamandrivorans]